MYQAMKRITMTQKVYCDFKIFFSFSSISPSCHWLNLLSDFPFRLPINNIDMCVFLLMKNVLEQYCHSLTAAVFQVKLKVLCTLIQLHSQFCTRKLPQYNSQHDSYYIKILLFVYFFIAITQVRIQDLVKGGGPSF